MIRSVDTGESPITSIISIVRGDYTRTLSYNCHDSLRDPLLELAIEHPATGIRIRVKVPEMTVAIEVS